MCAWQGFVFFCFSDAKLAHLSFFVGGGRGFSIFSLRVQARCDTRTHTTKEVGGRSSLGAAGAVGGGGPTHAIPASPTTRRHPAKPTRSSTGGGGGMPLTARCRPGAPGLLFMRSSSICLISIGHSAVLQILKKGSEAFWKRIHERVPPTLEAICARINMVSWGFT
jgi:hypothetical protein